MKRERKRNILGKLLKLLINKRSSISNHYSTEKERDHKHKEELRE